MNSKAVDAHQIVNVAENVVENVVMQIALVNVRKKTKNNLIHYPSIYARFEASWIVQMDCTPLNRNVTS